MIKIMHFSPHGENCGVGKYQEQYLEAMSVAKEFENSFFEFSPYITKNLSRKDFKLVVKRLEKELKEFDILHIQHVHLFFRILDQFALIVQAAKNAGVKVVITYHESLEFAKPDLADFGFGPRTLLAFIRSKMNCQRIMKLLIEPLNAADLILVHNTSVQRSIASNGVDISKVKIIPIPIPEIDTTNKTNTIADMLNKNPEDILIGLVGFLDRNKGILSAIKSMSFLPGNYKLAIIGGIHSNAYDREIEDVAADLILELKLRNRIIITGYIEDDDYLNSLICEIDICVYPYDVSYYNKASSASINLAIANEIPIVAYPVQSFIEMNDEFHELVLTKTTSYYELARSIKEIDRSEQIQRIKKYKSKYSYNRMAKELQEMYRTILS